MKKAQAGSVESNDALITVSESENECHSVVSDSLQRHGLSSP